jgi:hypothetical protein
MTFENLDDSYLAVRARGSWEFHLINTWQGQRGTVLYTVALCGEMHPSRGWDSVYYPSKVPNYLCRKCQDVLRELEGKQGETQE